MIAIKRRQVSNTSGIKIASARDNDLYTMTMKIAMMSEHRYKFGAIIARGKRIVSVGTNVFKTHPIYRNYGSFVNSIHAEYYAILRADDTVDCTMYIARYSINLKSKPCVVCMQLIKDAGIRDIVYHNGREVVKERIHGA